MSTGQMIGSIAGGVVGAIFGFGVGGAALGGMIGLWLDPLKPEPPDTVLGDLGINSYCRDMPVPLVYGHYKVYGGVIWIGNTGVIVEQEGDDKNPKYTVYYTAEFAIGFCEGLISGFHYWLINDKDPSELTEEDHIYLAASTWYFGSGSQTIDPYVSAYSGSSAVPWRYTAGVVMTGSIGRAFTLPSISAVIYGIQSLVSVGDWNANPIKVLYDFLTNTSYGCGISASVIDGSPTSPDTSWKIASDYCDVAIGPTENRFRYSNAFINKIKAYDIIKDILQTCRGFLYYHNGLLKVKIATNDEVPVFYFSETHNQGFVVSSFSSGGRIYADFSSYPVHNYTTGAAGYWEGDIGYITVNDINYQFIVLEQTATYIDVLDFTEDVNMGTLFTLVKDNIKKDSFTYSRRAKADRPNRCRVQFINEADDFRTDFIEVDNVYDINLTGEIRETTYQCSGITVKGQAARMAAFFSDFNTYVDYSCSFEVDIIGFMLAVGDIIGITNYIPGWAYKQFRIISLEEMEDYTVKVECVEYIPSIFSDNADPYYPTDPYNPPNPYEPPLNSTYLKIYEDSLENCLRITFNKDLTHSYWLGNEVYISFDGVTYEFFDFFGITTPSVCILNTISLSDETIAYDPAQMFDSFPASGSFWIDSEEVYYSSIDDDTDEFLGCVRGYNNTQASIHSAGAVASLRKSTTPKYTYADDIIGGIIYFKTIAKNIYGVKAKDTPPTDTIEIEGFFYKPKKVSSLELNGQGNDHTLVASDDAVLSWSVVSEGFTSGYGYCYGEYGGYGQGTYNGIESVLIRVYNTFLGTLLRSYEIVDVSSELSYNYTAAYNISDNGSYCANLTFQIYTINDKYLWSFPNILVTND